MSVAQQTIFDRYQSQVDELLEQMTLKEKVGQMTQVTLDVVLEGEAYAPSQPILIDEEKLDRVISEYQVGSILNTPSGVLIDLKKWREILTQIHSKAAQTRLKVPIIYGIDAIHGVNYCRGATIFPQPISVANSWNTAIAQRIGEITAYEARAAGLPWNFSPTLDVGRNPEWPRLWESFGEDVYMNTVMGAAMTTGYQGINPAQKDKVGACLKHFTGYGIPLSGKDRTPAWIPERYLREYYLPAYEASIELGALSVMINSGEINGIPVHASKEILTDILRGDLGFRGLAVSDWQDIIYLHTRHKVAPTMKDAVRQAIEAGIDMSMTPTTLEFADLLVELVEEGTIPESRIDESVRRILGVKFALGLFDETLYPVTDYPKFGSDEYKQVSLEAATESIVLLKNEDDILPLPEDATILLTGPAAHSMRALNGGWTGTWQGDIADEMFADDHTIREALEARFGADNVKFVEGANWEEPTDMERAMALANTVDYVVLCLGETSYTEDSGNLNDLYISESQTELAEAMARTGKPVILVLAEGRPRVISRFEEDMAAVVGAFLPGPQGGDAVATILAGDANPSGKLAFTYPQYPNSLVPYDHKYTEDREVMISGASFNPQYTFGYGLSYTSFDYSNLELSSSTMTEDGEIEVSVTVQNTGARAGKEVVQLYISDLFASITPPVRRLRDFDKVMLEPGEKKTVTFTISFNDIAFVGRDNEWTAEPGTFTVTVGDLTEDFELK